MGIEKGQEKNNVLQIMRGIAIVFVLLRHAIAQVETDSVLKAVEQIIICFHMPAFFIIAGYLYQKRLSKYLAQGKICFIMGKVRHLLLPYAFWTVFLWGGSTDCLPFRRKFSEKNGWNRIRSNGLQRINHWFDYI
jgi:uncharacterized membrane protein YcfT